LALARHEAPAAAQLISQVLDTSPDLRLMAQAATLAAALDDAGTLEQIATALTRRLDRQSRAYAAMVEGLRARVAQDFTAAEGWLRKAVGISDLWMPHLQLADLYGLLDMALEARLELDVCLARAGEGVTAYINRIPTCRYLARAQRSR
jgi:hypothetical protein